MIHHFGSKDGLRKACDEFIAETIRAAKSESVQTSDPAAWFAQMAEIESFAPLMAYLVRSMQTGGDLAKSLWRTMIANAEQYIEEGVRGGHHQAQPRPQGQGALPGDQQRRRLPAVPADARRPDRHLRAVLHDYAQDMVLPALEIYTQGLMTDSTMYDAFAAQHATGKPIPTSKEE